MKGKKSLMHFLSPPLEEPKNIKNKVLSSHMNMDQQSIEESDDTARDLEGLELIQKKSFISTKTGAGGKKSLTSLEILNAIFNKPADEREKSDRDKIVAFLLQIPFF